MGFVLSAVVRVVVFVPLLVTMYGLFNAPRLWVVATTENGVDVVALAAALGELPQIHIVVLVSVVVAVLGPYLPARSDLG